MQRKRVCPSLISHLLKDHHWPLVLSWFIHSFFNSFTIFNTGAHKIYKTSYPLRYHCKIGERDVQKTQHIQTSVSCSFSVVSHSLQHHGLQSTRLLPLWDFPGKNTGMGCHFLLQGILLTQGSNPYLLLGEWILYHCATREAHSSGESEVAQSCLLFGTPWTIVD